MKIKPENGSRFLLRSRAWLALVVIAGVATLSYYALRDASPGYEEFFANAATDGAVVQRELNYLKVARARLGH